MSKIVALLRREPVRAYLLGVVITGIAALKVFGVDLSGEQVAAVATFAAATLGFGEFVRSKVSPVS